MSASQPRRHWTIRCLLAFPPVRVFTALLYELGVNRIDALCERMDRLEEGFKSLAEDHSALLDAAIKQQEQNATLLKRIDELDAKLDRQAER